MDELADLRQRLEETIAEDPPALASDPGVIRRGFDAELDELRDLSQHSRQIIAAMEDRERKRTGIASLKIRYNQVFGFYLEVSKANLHLVPADFERKQTLVNAERFTTPELKEYERKVLAADERIAEIERQLFGELRAWVAQQSPRLRRTGAAVAQLDVLANLARLAASHNYTRPEFTDTGELMILGGRHPVIELLLEQQGERFVPNALYLNSTTHQILLITGPNMGGKSTYLRQAALIVLLAQIGSFVPAEQARLPITDRIFTRIGASDNLARGRSTFLVEMSEVAAILNLATPQSLVLLDEVGRGTATFDGLSLAWAVVEHLHAQTHARTLFATHYHELTELAELLPGVKNIHVAVEETPNEIVFLRRDRGRQRRQELWHRGRATRGLAARGHRTRPRNSAAPRTERAPTERKTRARIRLPQTAPASSMRSSRRSTAKCSKRCAPPIWTACGRSTRSICSRN